MTTIIRCPRCNQFRSPGPADTCPICAARRAQRQRRLTTLALSLAGLAFAIALATLLAGCSGTHTTSTAPTLHRQTLNQIRSNLLSESQNPQPATRNPQPATPNSPPLTPFTLPPGQLYAIDPVYCDNGQYQGAPYAYCDNRRY